MKGYFTTIVLTMSLLAPLQGGKLPADNANAGLEARLAHLEQKVAGYDKLITNHGYLKVENPVAFHVALSEEFGPISEDAVVPFDVIKQNLGGGFNEESHTFVAPVAGVYFFTATAVGDSGTFCVMNFYHNGELVQRVSGRADGKIEEWSNSNMLYLEADDSVWYEGIGDDYHRLLGTPEGLDTSFTGFLYAEGSNTKAEE